jgi:hypothetical protein
VEAGHAFVEYESNKKYFSIKKSRPKAGIFVLNTISDGNKIGKQVEWNW